MFEFLREILGTVGGAGGLIYLADRFHHRARFGVKWQGLHPKVVDLEVVNLAEAPNALQGEAQLVGYDLTGRRHRVLLVLGSGGDRSLEPLRPKSVRPVLLDDQSLQGRRDDLRILRFVRLHLRAERGRGKSVRWIRHPGTQVGAAAYWLRLLRWLPARRFAMWRRRRGKGGILDGREPARFGTAWCLHCQADARLPLELRLHFDLDRGQTRRTRCEQCGQEHEFQYDQVRLSERDPGTGLLPP